MEGGEGASAFLPEPEWGGEPTCISFPSVARLEALCQHIQRFQKETMQAVSFYSFPDLFHFYEHYKTQGNYNVEACFRKYDVTLQVMGSNCATMAVQFAEKLNNSSVSGQFPELKGNVAVFCCDFRTESPYRSLCGPPSATVTVPEHAVNGVRFTLGSRPGYLIMDDAFHIPFPIIIMADRQHPHTGWFVYKDDDRQHVKFCMELEEDTGYVHWKTYRKKHGVENNSEALIYVKQRYINALQVAGKYSVAHAFRSLVVRNENGPLAGAYWHIGHGGHLTVFYTNKDGRRVHTAIDLDYFDSDRGNDKLDVAIATCEEQTQFGAKFLDNLVVKLRPIGPDKKFAETMIKIRAFMHRCTPDDDIITI